MGSHRENVVSGNRKAENEGTAERFGPSEGSPQRDPTEAIDGILADLNANPVDLQHEARRLWASKVLERATS
jgi:hypothetical protein